MRRVSLAILVCSAGTLASSPLLARAQSAAHPWTQFAGGASRVSIAAGAPPSIAAPRWVCSTDQLGMPVTFQGQAGVVADDRRVFAVGRIAGAWHLLGISADTGRILWAAPVPAPTVDSWSTPALDPVSQTVFIAAGQSISAFDTASGALRWALPLTRSIVNASPLITTDRGPRDRLLITDYNPFGGGAPASLLCVNIDPFDASTNPYQPGQLVWSLPVGNAAGNSPAYRDGIVYVALAPDSASDLSRIIARGIDDPPAAPDRWTLELTEPGQGFFGGITIADTPFGPSVYAATYNFFGGFMNSLLIAASATDGTLRWAAPSNRTSSTPIPLPGGFVALSAGINGFGSAPSLQLFRDDGAAATLLADTALQTWTDLNANLAMDPGETLPVGGWSTLPVAAPLALPPGPGPAIRLYAGGIPASAGTNSACTDLFALDLSRAAPAPTIIERFTGAGSTPAIVTHQTGATLFTVGAAGLHAFGATPCYPNCDGSTTPPTLNAIDFACFLARYRAADAYANCDASTIPPALNALDFTCFLARYREGCP